MIWGVLIGGAGMLVLVVLILFAFATGHAVGAQKGAAERERDLRARYPMDALDQAHAELDAEDEAASAEEDALRRAEEILRRNDIGEEGKA